MLAESSASAILYHLDDGTLAYVNAAAERITGYSRDELLKFKIWDLLHPDFRPVVERRLRARQAGENIISQNEVKMIIKSGETRWINYTAGRVLIEGKQSIIAMATDVTERKRAEEELKASHEQLRALAARLESVREEEGTRIAREIHDELGSALTGLKWDLERLNNALTEAGDRETLSLARGKLQNMLGTIDNTINTVRRISSELRPGVLDDLGLVAAIEWQARQFSLRTGMDCQFQAGVEEVGLSRQASTAVFRVFQEILTNILRHSQAGKVWVRAFEREHYFILEVRDNGRGISESEKNNSRSLGLLGMRERAHLIDARIEISGIKGEGTTVTIRVPLPMAGDTQERLIN
jgi:PAS domain S-box-containing protein